MLRDCCLQYKLTHIVYTRTGHYYPKQYIYVDIINIDPNISIRRNKNTLPSKYWHHFKGYIDSLVQDDSISIAIALDAQQSCTKPWISFKQHSNVNSA